MKFLSNKKTTFLFLSIVILSLFSKIVFADWNGLFYNPGDTLNPECLPTDPNCDVIAPLTLNNLSSATTSGALSSADWNTFNGKQNALDSGVNIKTIGGTSLLGSGDIPFPSVAGFIPYIGGTSNVDFGIHNLTVDTNSLFVDSTNHRVGIGTTSPGFPLEVNGTIIADNNTFGGKVTTGAAFNYVIQGSKTSGDSFKISDTGGTTFFREDGTGNIYAGASATGGSYNVTNEPTTNNITWNKDTNVVINAQGRSNTSGKTGFTLKLANALTVAGSKVFALQNGATEVLTVDNTGNVGIGTTTPSATLSVVGNGYYNTNSTSAFLVSQVGVHDNTLRVDTTNGYVGINVVPTAQLDVNGTAYFRSGFYTNNIQPYSGTQVQLGNSGGVYIPGNVGIGTTGPSQKLDVNGVITLQDGGVRTLPAGLTTEVNSSILEFGMNEGSGNRFGTYVQANQGGFFRFDGRASNTLLQIWGRVAGVASGAGNQLWGIDSSGNVTTAGSQTVTGNIYAPNAILNAPVAGNFAELFLQDAGTTKWQIGKDNNNNLRIWNNAGSATAMEILNNGNVGIGTTSPSAILDIKGSTTDATKSFIVRDSGNTEQFSVQNNGVINLAHGAFTVNQYGGFMANDVGGFGVSNGGAAQIIVRNNSVDTTRVGLRVQGNNGQTANLFEAMKTTNGTTWNAVTVIDKDGNVGIGTTAPGSKLDVNGVARITGSTAPSSGAGLELQYGGTGDILAYDRTGSVYQPLRLRGSTLTLFGGNGSSGLYVDSSGNVGIGTTSPGGGLDISNGGLSLIFGADNNATTRTTATSKYGRLAIPAYTNGDPNFITFFGGTESGVNKVFYGGGTGSGYAATLLSFYTAANSSTYTGTERMRIDSAGNVGIGTTAPGQKLEINGNLAFTGSGTISTPSNTGILTLSGGSAGGTTDAIVFQKNGSTLMNINGGTDTSVQIHAVGNASLDGLQIIGAGAWTGNYLTLKSSGGATVFDVTSSGNVGIGTTAPTAKLSLKSSSTASRVFDVTSSDSQDIVSLYEESDTSGSLYFADTSGAWNAKIAGNGASYFKGGNVGIGTTAPAYALEVASNAAASGGRWSSTSTTQQWIEQQFRTGIYNNSSTRSNAMWAFGLYQTGTASNVNDNFYIGRSGLANDFVINRDGNVGIGTTAPASTLQIGSGQILVPDGTAVAPSIALTNATGSGFYNSGSGGIGVSMGGTLRHKFTSSEFATSGITDITWGAFQLKTGSNNAPILNLSSGGLIAFSNTANNIATVDTGISRGAAGKIYVGNGTQGDSSGTLITGNVGIGINAPAAKLDILDTTLAGSGSLAGSVINLAQTWNTTGAPTAIKLNVTNTASDAASLLMDLQVGGVSKFSVNKVGAVSASGNSSTSGSFSALAYSNTSSGVPLYLLPYSGVNSPATATSLNGVQIGGSGYATNYSNVKTGGQQNWLAVLPVYNQVASTAANTDLLINRTETAVGSGAQNLIDAQVGGVSKFSVNNTGTVTSEVFNGTTLKALTKTVTITGASNTTPIIVTAVAHGLQTGDTILIKNITGNTNANGYFKITVLSADTFSLQNYSTGADIAGNGTYGGSPLTKVGYVQANAIYTEAGTTTRPTILFGSQYNGLSAISSSGVSTVYDGTETVRMSNIGIQLLGGDAYTLNFGLNSDAIISRGGVASIQLGNIDINGSPVAQTLRSQGAKTGTDLTAGVLNIQHGQGTGAGTAGSINFQVATPQATGTTAQPYVTALTIKDSGTGGTSAPQVLVPGGTSLLPGIANTAYPSTGIRMGNGLVYMITAGSNPAYFGNNEQYLALGLQLANTHLTGPANGTFQLGAANAAAPVAQILQAQGSRGGTDTDIAGGNLTIQSGAGTGAAIGSSLIFQTPLATTTGTTAQTQTERMKINGLGQVAINGAVPGSGSQVYIKASAAMEPLVLQADNGYQMLRFQTRTGTDRAWFGNDTGDKFSIKNLTSGGNIYLTTTGTGNVVIDNGNVGIGMVPAATNKLDIADTTLAGSGSLAGSVLNLAQTWNTTGAPTAIKLNVTNTASDTASSLMDLQVGGVSKFNVNKFGQVVTPVGYYSGNGLYATTSANTTATLRGGVNQSGAFSRIGISLEPGSFSNTVSPSTGVQIIPTYNQASATGMANTDLLINRTETSLGTTPGAQYLIDAQVGGVSKFKVDNGGNTTLAETLGPELISNGTFNGNSTGWTVYAGCAYNGSTNAIDKTGAGTTCLNQGIVATTGSYYKVIIVTSNVTVEGLNFNFGGATGTYITTNGTHTYYIKAVGTNSLNITPTSTNSRFSVNSVSVRLVTNANIYAQNINVTGEFGVTGVSDGGSTYYMGLKPYYSMNNNVNPTLALVDGTGGTNPTFRAYNLISENSLTTGWLGISSTSLYGNNAGFGIKAAGVYGWTSTTAGSDTKDLILSRAGAASLQLGAADVNGAPVAQTLRTQGAVTGTDLAAGALTIQHGQGTGAGTAGSIVFQVATPQATGATAQPYVTALTLKDSGTSGTSKPQVMIADGTAGVPSLAFINGSGTGIYSSSPSSRLNFAVGGVASLTLNTASYQFFQNGVSTTLVIPSDAVWQFGAAASATPVAQTLKVQDATGTDTAAAAQFTIRAPAGTGAGTSGKLVFTAPVAGTTGTTAQTQNTILTLQDSGTGGTSKPLGTFAGSVAFSGSSTTYLSTCSNGVACIGTSDGSSNVNLRAYDFEASASATWPGFQQGNSYLLGVSAGVWQLGKANAAAPVSQTLQAQGSRGGTDTDISGGNLTIQSGAGTGAATGSSLIFQTPLATTTGTTAQTQIERMRITGAGNVGIGTTGPLGLLHISANTAAQFFFSDTSQAAGSKTWVMRNSSTKFSILPTDDAGSASADAIYIMRTGNTGIGYTDPGTAKLAINGNVGIGTTAPAQKLSVLGAAGDTSVLSIATTSGNTCTFTTVSGTFSCVSDERLKNEITSIGSADALTKLSSLNPVTFHYNWQNTTDPLVSGFLAQEFEKVFPELVTTDPVTGYKSLTYAPLMPYTISAIQELNLNLEGVAGTITPLAGSAQESFVTIFFDNVKTKVGAWLADATNGIAKIFTGEIDTKSLCVSDDSGAKTCITKSQLDALILGATVTTGQAGGNTLPPPVTPPATPEVPTCVAPQILVNNVCTDLAPASAPDPVPVVDPTPITDTSTTPIP